MKQAPIDAPPRIPICFFDSQYDNEPKSARLTLEQLREHLTTFSIRESKDGPLFSLAVYEPGTTRARDNVAYRVGAELDLDYDITLKEIEDKISGLNAVLYTTFRHTPEFPRYRVVIFFSRAVPRDDWPDIWQRLNHYFGAKVDKATKDASRMNYLPACPDDSAGDAFSQVYDGEFLDPYSLPEAPQEEVKLLPKTYLNGAANGGYKDNDRARKWALEGLRRESEKVRTASDGYKHPRLLASAVAMGGLVPSGAINADEVEESLYEAVKDRAKDKRAARDTIRDGIDYGIARPRAFPDFIPQIITAPDGRKVQMKKNDEGELVEVEPDEPLHFTDNGNAIRFVRQHGKIVRYCFAWGKWLIWTGKVWKVDDEGLAVQLAKQTARSLWLEVATCKDGDYKENLAKHAKSTDNQKGINAMLWSARSEPGIPVTPDSLDADLWVLNCNNGTVDLRTGELRPHSQSDLCSKLVPVDYDPIAVCPKWIEFLYKVMGSNETTIRFLQKAVGSALTGITRDRVIFILHGGGANGKSTFLETLMALIADYGRAMDSETLMAKRQQGAPTNDLARLHGARFVSTSESDEGQRLASGRVKKITGCETITARFLNHEFFEFRPQFKIFMATNHVPIIRETDKAIWDRIRLVPFKVRFWDADKGESGEPQFKMDKTLARRLLEELPGILNWAVQGCLLWQKEGLGYPSEVKEATEGYKLDMDTLGVFLEECCTEGPNLEITAKRIYEIYSLWCERNGEHKATKTKLGRQLSERGFISDRTGPKGCFWHSIGEKSFENTSLE